MLVVIPVIGDRRKWNEENVSPLWQLHAGLNIMRRAYDNGGIKGLDKGYGK
jgi:hypothetical protein